MNDDELKEVLKEWRAPKAPADLEARTWARKSKARFDLAWLLTGSIRVPVPAIILVLVAIMALLASLRRPEPQALKQTGLAGFQPVHQLKPRVVGRDYAVQ